MMQDESTGALAKEFDGLIAKSQVSSWRKQPPQGVGVVEVIIASTSPVLVSTKGTAATAAAEKSKARCQQQHRRHCSRQRSGLNAIDKEQELVIHLLRGIMTKR